MDLNELAEKINKRIIDNDYRMAIRRALEELKKTTRTEEGKRMRSILISIKPQWVTKILNGEKTIEVRKTAPNCRLPIEVYIYCTKGKPNLWLPHEFGLDNASQPYLSDKPLFDIDAQMNGKVVAKFRLERVHNFFQMPPDKEWVLKASCLSEERLLEYIGNSPWYGWEIKNLVIFDEPKELSEFDYPNPSGIRNIGQRSIKGLPSKKHPPQSWCYVEDRG